MLTCLLRMVAKLEQKVASLLNPSPGRVGVGGPPLDSMRLYR